MAVVHVNPNARDERLLNSLYQGELSLFTDVAAVSRLVDHLRSELSDLLAPHDPEEAHLHLDPSAMAALLGRWKPRFIHDERSHEFLRQILLEIGMPADHTHVDFAKPRMSFPVGHLNTGIAYAFPWHRDTWYGAPPQQINWWLPVYEVTAENAMRFDLESFGTEVANDSESFDYYQANHDRLTTSTQVGVERQPRPKAIGNHVVDDAFVILPPVGSVLAFSGAHLHATIPNSSGRARYSLDFRTIDRRHVGERVGAPMLDVACTGTALRDFVSVGSGARVDEGLVQRLYGSPPDDAILVFDKDISSRAAQLLPGPDRQRSSPRR